MKKLCLMAVLAAALPLATQQPAQAVGGPCNGIVDVQCSRCMDKSQVPPKRVPSSKCTQQPPNPEVERENCTVYVDPSSVSDLEEICVVG